MDYFLELYGTLPRAGPGDEPSTRRAFSMVQHLPPHPRILDIGCGPGMQTVELLRLCEGTVVAVDLLPSMIARTRQAAERAGVSSRLELVQIDMNQMAFEPASFDLIWSEGAIYIMGFENGLERMRHLVRPGGHVVVSEAVWLRPDPPARAIEFWQEYPEIDTLERKLEVVSRTGYEAVGHFVLPPEAWTRHYYDHLAVRVAECEPGWKGDSEGEAALREARTELAVFEECSESFSYAFFVMRR
jgi:SAM-dependent methyltransferase